MRTTIPCVAALLLIAASCGTEPATELRAPDGAVAAAARQDDNRTLEEKVDTDGDGEMSEDEIETYARSTLLEFSQCMRDNGYPDFTDVVLEDFTEGGGGQGRFLGLMAERGVSLADENAVPTLQSCGSALSDLQTFAPQPSDEEQQETEAAVLEFAACMRSTGGVPDWPDPDFANNTSANGYGPEILQQFDLQSDEIQNAIETCQAEAAVALGDGADGDAGADGPAGDGTAGDDTAVPVDDGPVEREALSPVIEGDTTDLDTAVVTRRDLIETRSLDGTLGYGEQRPFPTNTTGIVTRLPEPGDVIGIGEPLFWVDDEPVLLLQGDLPQYRAFRSGMADGGDITQLERNLVQLGYAEDLDLTVDDDFTAITRDAVEEMQRSLGIDDDGRIDLGRVAFSIRPVRVSDVHVELGQSISPQVHVLSVTGDNQRIVVDLDAEDRSLLDVGAAVEIELPDGSVVPGEVTEIAAVATRSINPQTGNEGDATIEVTVGFVGAAPDVFDAAPVEVIVTEQVTAGVLTLPVPALVALSGGGHGVELIVDGGTQLVAVELGDFVDDIVEVRGVGEGDRVVMATAG